MNFSTKTPSVEALVATLAQAAMAKHHRFVTSESCTGGLLASYLTSIPGSSAWFDGGWVTYRTESKTAWLGVDPELIETHGVVSDAVAMAMARGALAHASADVTCAVGITGSAGPDTYPGVPVGRVWIGWAYRFNDYICTAARLIDVPGDRSTVRQTAVVEAIKGLLRLVEHKNPAKG